ncbi:MAG: threonine/serine dehydratase [Bacteroidota bacterium]
MITFSDIEDAYRILKPVVHKTPLLSSRTLNGTSANEIYFKAENFQRVGAFKFRGAYNKIASLTEDQRKRGVIAHSSGNHAQGVALAAKLFGIKAVIVMPQNSVSSKIEATKEYGAEVVFCGTTINDRERKTNELISAHGYTLIHPFHDEKIICGQGTVVLEIFKEMQDLDYLFVPIGGGGLIAGCAIAAKNLFPAVKVIGVETEGANDCWRSIRAGKIISLASVNTIADGMRTNAVGAMNFGIIQKYVDDVITVSDDDLYPMMKYFIERMKIIVEPTGAVAPAAAMKNAMGIRGKKICAVISGGNIDPALLKKIF